MRLRRAIMEVIDFSNSKELHKKRHHELLPDPLFAVLLGPTGCGKTNLLTNMVLRWTDWERLIVCCPTDDQAVYDPIREFNDLVVRRRLEEATETADEAELEAIACEDPVSFIHDVDQIPSPDELDGTPTLLVADDVMLENQENVSRIFCRGRHKQCHAIYLSQSFATTNGRKGGVPPVVRRQLTLLCLFHGLDNKSLRAVFDEYCAGDMDWPEFQEFFRKAAGQQFDFAVLDLREKSFAGKYRRRFKDIYVPKEDICLSESCQHKTDKR